MSRNTPIPSITIGSCTHFTSDGEADYSQFEIEVAGEIDSYGTILLDDVADLFRLRKAIDSYISANNLENPYQ